MRRLPHSIVAGGTSVWCDGMEWHCNGDRAAAAAAAAAAARFVASSRSQPQELKQFMRHRVEIAARYPDLFIDFVRDLALAAEHVNEGQNIALLKDSTDIVTAGSDESSPVRFYGSFIFIFILMIFVF